MSKAHFCFELYKNISVAFSDFVFYLADAKSGDPDVINKTSLRFSQIDIYSPYSFLKCAGLPVFITDHTLSRIRNGDRFFFRV